jgi:uncharacterized protein YbjT (DUF2867 family)
VGPSSASSPGIQEKAKGLFGSGVKVLEGDLGRPDSMEPAMRGVETLFLLSSPDPGSPALQTNALAAAKRAGVKRVVKMSAISASRDSASRFLRLHGEMDDELASSGLTWTRLRPHSFMQNTLMFVPSILSDGAFYTPPSGVMPVVDVRDIAAVACAVLLEKGHEGKDLHDHRVRRAFRTRRWRRRSRPRSASRSGYVEVPTGCRAASDARSWLARVGRRGAPRALHVLQQRYRRRA